jgi:hypothetical protein
MPLDGNHRVRKREFAHTTIRDRRVREIGEDMNVVRDG